MRQLTDWKGTDNNPRWSPDGRTIAYTRSVSDEAYHMYDEPILCVIPAAGGTPRLLSRSLDREANLHPIGRLTARSLLVGVGLEFRLHPFARDPRG